MRTLLEIFQTESDDAEIYRPEIYESVPTKVSLIKTAEYRWKDLNDPVWQVKRRPRTAWAEMRSDGIYSNLTDLKLKDGERINLVEIIEND